MQTFTLTSPVDVPVTVVMKAVVYEESCRVVTTFFYFGAAQKWKRGGGDIHVVVVSIN